MSGETVGAGLLTVSLKCSARLALWSSLPERFLVISYNFFMFLWQAAVSAASASSSMKLFLSLFRFFFSIVGSSPSVCLEVLLLFLYFCLKRLVFQFFFISLLLATLCVFMSFS